MNTEGWFLEDWALFYAGKGLPVFPVKPKDKTPLTPHGCGDATTELKRISAWWKRWPNANIGIATGAGSSPVVVLDVDIKYDSGKFGDDSIEKLVQQYGPLPETWLCLTGGGGLHYYFHSSDPALTNKANFEAGLDFRGHGGYVVAPPSVHATGRRYEWEASSTPEDGAEIAELPEWLHDILTTGKLLRPAYEVPETVAEGARNQEMFRMAASLRAKGLTVDELTAAVLKANEHRCNPPLTDQEILTICRSAGRYERGELREPKRQQRVDDSAKPYVVDACDVPYERPRWTIKPYFQRGKGTLIQADNGMGKTIFACGIAAAVSTGRPILNIPVDAAGDVLILSTEDDLPVLRGRIEESGGDLTKCHLVGNTASLAFNSPEIEEYIKTTKAKMIIFDPLQAFMGASVDMFRANETRPALAKLFEMCSRNDCSCVIIAHVGKSSADKSPVNRSLGSVDIPAAMRSIIQIIENPENELERVAVQVKCSNAQRGRSIVYAIGDKGGVMWTGFSPLTDKDLDIVARRKERGIPYESEPLAQVFNQLIEEKNQGGFWSYADLKAAGAKILGFPPFGDAGDLKARLAGTLSKELQINDGLIVTVGVKCKGERGVRIERYRVPEAYQTRLQE